MYLFVFVFILSVERISSNESNTGNSRTSELKCLFNDHISGLKCFNPEAPKLPSHDKALWSSFMGIGPSKTGSSSVFKLLEKHKKILIANSIVGGKGCCSSELYHFTEAKEVDKGIMRYLMFYNNTDHKNIEAAGEKTPFYFSHPLVPYRARAILSKSLKLIFTYRDPVEADISLYFHRAMAARFKMSYYEWLYPRLEGLKNWLNCRETAFQSLLVENSTNGKDYISIRDLHNQELVTWETAHNIEVFLMEKCAFGTPTGPYLSKAIYPQDYLQERLYIENLKRWVHVFGKDNILCISNDEQSTNIQNVLDKLIEFLGVNPAGMDGYKPVNYPSHNITHRLLESQQKLNSDSVDQMLPAINALREFLDFYETKEDRAWFKDVCG